MKIEFVNMPSWLEVFSVFYVYGQDGSGVNNFYLRIEEVKSRTLIFESN